MSQITWSDESNAFFKELLETKENILLKACAGSGKTTNIVEACRRVPQPARVVFLAFNRNIADELAERMPYYAIASTFHSYCYDAIKRVVGKMNKPEGRKCAYILKKLVPEWKDRRDWEDDALTLCSRAKSFGYGALAGCPTLTELADRFNLEVSRFDLVERILALSLADRTTLDFDDMLLHALVYNVPFDPCNYLFVDEAQDTNVVQLELLARMLGRGPGGDGKMALGAVVPGLEAPRRPRLIAVGDPSQAIYGFRGADASALRALRDRFSMREMPLSVTYRCSKAVAAAAAAFESNLDPNPEEEARCRTTSPHAELLRTPIDPDESTDPMDFHDDIPF